MSASSSGRRLKSSDGDRVRPAAEPDEVEDLMLDPERQIFGAENDLAC